MAKKTYINNGGQHMFKDRTVVNNGETFTTEEDLSAFGEKFTEVVKATEPADKPAAPAEVAPSTEKPANGDSGAEKGTDGGDTAPVPTDKDNVTADFENATEDVVVLKDKKGWWVHDTDDLAEPVNEKPLRKKDVEAFLADYCGE